MTRIERNGDGFFIAVCKDDERYVFAFDRGHIAEVLRTLIRFASDPDLSFTWYDASRTSKAVMGCLRDGDGSGR